MAEDVELGKCYTSPCFTSVAAHWLCIVTNWQLGQLNDMHSAW